MPAGTNHIVSSGECVLSIADQNGLFWETLWNHPQNQDLKNLRADPNILQAGDELFVPEKEIKEESCGTEVKHRFKRKGVPGKLKVRVMINDEAQASARYRLVIDGRAVEGTTDGDGFVEESLPPGAREGELRVEKDGKTHCFFLQFGHLDPLGTDSGVSHRLAELGFPVEPSLESAVRAFQRKHGLDETGQIDDGLRSKLKDVYGQ